MEEEGGRGCKVIDIGRGGKKERIAILLTQEGGGRGGEGLQDY